MQRTAKLFLWTLLVSFVGSLPLGTLNVSITNLALYKGGGAAFAFGLAAITVELLLVRTAVEGIERLEKLKRYLRLFHWLSSLVLLFFAVASIIAAIQMKTFGASLRVINTDPFTSGLLLSVLNPLQLPFWLSWTAAFKTKGILCSTRRDYNLYVISIGLGTAVAFVVYGSVGRVLIQVLEDKQFLLNWAVGIVLFFTAAIQVKKNLWKQLKPGVVKLQNGNRK